jgi:hypothetical protein
MDAEPSQARQAGRLECRPVRSADLEDANSGERAKSVSHEREALGEQVLAAIGQKKDPSHSAQGTLVNILRDFADGKTDVGGRWRPFDGQPGVKNPEAMLDLLDQLV